MFEFVNIYGLNEKTVMEVTQLPIVYIVTRSFEKGATPETFDQGKFDNGLKPEIEKWRRFPEVRGIMVVTNHQPGHSMAEVVDDDGRSPTIIAIQTAGFEGSPRVEAVGACVWGPNAGSTEAINLGWQQLVPASYWYDPSVYLLVVSPELKLTQELYERALSYMSDNRDCVVAGFCREGWDKAPQYRVPQNTGAIWWMPAVARHGFSPLADGWDGKMIETSEGLALRAGMDDFELYDRLLLADPNARIAMIGSGNQLPWNIDHDDERQRQKAARQFAVALDWIRIHRKQPEMSDGEATDVFNSSVVGRCAYP